VRERLSVLVDEGEIRLFRAIAESSIPELIDRGIEGLAMYHARAPAVATGQGVKLNDMNLLCYYGNRVRCVL
jgi:hypothetical protein